MNIMNSRFPGDTIELNGGENDVVVSHTGKKEYRFQSLKNLTLPKPDDYPPAEG
jgi:hypothetical protein